jgi:glycolate oxidase FAD binding subunit
MLEEFRRRILAASRERPLRIRGGGSKDFYGSELRGEVLDTRGHAGIVSYEPTELVITARAGTPLAEIEATLAEQGQFLACEPPCFGGAATVGGLVAAGLSGPRRAAVGAVRDFVLGIRLMDGEGRDLTFGGQVMKNVAGYDVSRLMAGSLGTLGLILEASIKVLPRPVAELTLRFELPQARALESLNAWAGQPLPISASAWHDGTLSLRLSGARAAVAAARDKLGGEAVADGPAAAFWADLREQRLDFFAGDEPLWRLSLPSVVGVLDLPGGQLIEWGGAQRWWRGGLAPARLHELASRAGGHALLFRGGGRAAGVFQPLPPPLMQLHRQLKAAFDPRGVLNPGRLYPDL